MTNYNYGNEKWGGRESGGFIGIFRFHAPDIAKKLGKSKTKMLQSSLPHDC